jgi:NAD(P)-dependent dehydrogenase (short-subunit alcohol dehydrogenase family)
MSQTIVISGASRGIGLELTRQYLKQGCRIIAGVRKPSNANELQELSRIEKDQLQILELDVANDDSVSRFAKSAATYIQRLDLLINNAGVYLDQEQTIETLDSKMILETLNVNSVGPFRLTQAMIPLLRKSKAPKVATISSMMGSIADNGSGGAYAYRMSKACVNMFVKTLAVDERDLTAITLHPGWVQTSMGGERAPLSVEKSAEGLLTVIASSGPNDSGKFFNHAGRELPW